MLGTERPLVDAALGPPRAELGAARNLPFSGWGGVLDDQAVAAAMIDRVVHHADVLTLKGASYRLRNRGIDTLPSIRTQTTPD
ncbi:ATP-binding protein [Jannaschia sp. R86511]|uniref:ATP-binding protein n=1 Tax=Jannaschia sp. R86511 TaxID=3093853 RepID=UPI0036D3C1A6